MTWESRSEELPGDWVELDYIRVTKCLTQEGVKFWIYVSPELNEAEQVGMMQMLEEHFGY